MSGREPGLDCLEIAPGAVVVDMSDPSFAALDSRRLGEAMDEALVQAQEEDAGPLEAIGDLDIHPG